MTELTQQQRIDRLAIEFMGWHRLPGDWWGHQGCFAAPTSWNPFESHDDAHLLLLECERRGLLDRVLDTLRTAVTANEAHWPGPRRVSWCGHNVEKVFMATAAQKTEAVESVAGLGD